MITCPGDRRQEALQTAEKHEFNGIHLRITPRARQINSSGFLHSLIENLEDRLFTTGSFRQQSVSAENKAQYSELLDHFKVLHPANWPVPLQLAQRFTLDDRKILEDFRDFKDNSSIIPENIAPLVNIHHLTLVSTAECERGFSLMNVIVCRLRCSLHIATVSSLMFINLNGPPLTKFNPTHYVKSWLVKHRGAMNPRTRPC